MQENQLFNSRKNHFLGLRFNMFERCACPVSLISIHACTRNTRLGHVTSFACGRNTSDRSLAWLHDTKIHAIDRDRGETWNTSGKPRAVAWKLTAPCTTVVYVVYWHAACSRRIVLDGHHPVMTGHNARRPRTGRERRPWWRPSEASYLAVWTLNDRLFASLVHCMLRRLLSEYWRKETEKSKFFCWVVGLDGRCTAQAEQRKNPWQLAHYRVLTCRQKQTWSRFVAWWKRSLIPDRQTDRHTHTHTHTHTHGIKASWTARAPALARTWPPARIIHLCVTYSFVGKFFFSNYYNYEGATQKVVGKP